MLNKYLDENLINEINNFWNELFYPEQTIKSSFRKWTKGKKIKKKRALRKKHKGTNWENKKPKRGYVRVLAPGGKTYVYKRMTQTQKRVRSKVGKRMGKQARRFR